MSKRTVEVMGVERTMLVSGSLRAILQGEPAIYADRARLRDPETGERIEVIGHYPHARGKAGESFMLAIGTDVSDGQICGKVVKADWAGLSEVGERASLTPLG